MTYDADGLRSTKTVGSTKTEYQYVGDKLFYENRGNGDSFYYFYDSYGKLAALYHHRNGTKVAYHVVTNAQGDVIVLYNWSGTKVAEYSYDAWGNCTIVSDTSSTGIATLNPFRYRGYYFDTDLGLYYLQSRYYDSEIGRFINADSTGLLAVSSGEISDKNLFSYCDNNPVCREDTTGNVWETVFDLVSLGFSIYDVVKNPNDIWAWAGLVGDAIDLIPFVAGIGEAIKIAKTVDKVADAVDTVHDSAKAIDNIGDSAQALNKFGVSSQCFIAGTLVLTGLGNKEIENIQNGDKVWAENPETGEKELKTVVQTFINETYELVHVFVNGEEIITTPNHPFYVPQKGWVSAINLRAGDMLVLHNGKYVIIEQIQHEILEAPVTVYNFEVEDFHTYYVGDISVLVHNVCVGPNNQMTFSTRRQAFNAAKRDLGIPRSQQPLKVGPNIDRRGNVVPGRLYDFGDGKYIRDDAAGHVFDDGFSLVRHFNTSKDTMHYFY